ncbi:transferrin-binding protein-like solute binding protein [Pseudooceanicola spongiae]|uniref:Transferrin-binding protein B C-lobe/N-lobe beta-barrel domain-containing protein n=1 Tax=Pseudooceanicola spongiae TaxID=2613965 RepID=A0A7L9WJP3_9RHOB|nr:transferrin-binding protein-like solute binding protein [Pseudooceanicola spongiae]QOL79917.1 hypothetical protein F3W81_03220 [Pseudooceanicola spongiae]
MTRFAFALMLAPFVLSACSGGGGGSVAQPETPVEMTQLDGLRALNATYGAAATTPLAAMPVTGSASYTGAAAFGGDTAMTALLAAPEMTADVALTADFASGKMTGRMDNFHTAGNEAVSGALLLSGGQIAGTALAGDLAGKVGARDIDAQLAGQFLTDSAQAVSGTVAGTDGAGANFSGAFIANR